MTKRILLVDDEQSMLFFVGENLAELGEEYEIDTAGSGEEALKKFAIQPFDLVVSDLRMPGIDGITLLQIIRQTNQNTHLILMTAYGSDRVEIAARSLQLHSYITKPFRVEELLDTVRAALIQDAESIGSSNPQPIVEDSINGN